jgi:nicotinate-nucleotide pyrophosphorylase (carboxylating)
MLEKYAVRVGGGCNHRMNLGDAILIKDNHSAALRAIGMGIKEIVQKARQNAPQSVTVEVEVSSTKEALEALKAGADVIMLDNMSPNEMKQVVNLVCGQAKIEASGGITLSNVHQVAMTGVDMISIGALTHSYKSLDMSLELEHQALKLI